MVGGSVGAYGHTLHGVEELHPVDAEHVGIVLRNHIAVFRILAHNQTANYLRLSTAETGVLAVEYYLHVATVLGNDVLEDVSGFLVENEGGFLFRFHFLGSVADELVGIGCHEGGGIGVYVEEDTVHSRADFVVGSGIDGA